MIAIRFLTTGLGVNQELIGIDTYYNSELKQYRFKKDKQPIDIKALQYENISIEEFNKFRDINIVLKEFLNDISKLGQRQDLLHFSSNINLFRLTYKELIENKSYHKEDIKYNNYFRYDLDLKALFIDKIIKRSMREIGYPSLENIAEYFKIVGNSKVEIIYKLYEKYKEIEW